MAEKLMRAGVVVKPNEIVAKDVEMPEIGRNEVLIKVKYCGICGTDLHILDGSYSAEYLPLIPGHEFVGHIAGAGSEVKKFTGGELVTADINLGCGECFYCRHNQILMCKECRQIGIHTNGAFAEYVSMPAHKVIRLPDDMTVINGALIEPVSCVVRSIRKSGLTFASSVVIIGAGPIGLTHLQMSRNCGCAPIIVTDVSRERLEYAGNMGADYTVLAGEGDTSKIKDLTDGRGADFVVESVGSVKTYEKAFEYVRPGGRIVVFGMTEASEKATFKPCEMVLTETSMTASVAGMGNDVHKAITMIRYNRFDLKPFTSVVYPLEKIAEAFDRAKNDKSILKTLVQMY